MLPARLAASMHRSATSHQEKTTSDCPSVGFTSRQGRASSHRHAYDWLDSSARRRRTTIFRSLLLGSQPLSVLGLT
jgi:hypothetical protein